MSVILVMTNLPDRAAAEKLAALVVEERLAACVNLLAPCTSIYQWKGSVEHAEEVPLLIKTTEERYASLEAAIRSAHPYETPEIVTIPITAGLPEYLAWVAAETQTERWPSL
ncbi:MAG: divalent-cation tolerance protein CutA [Propionivibrio sp.]